MAKKNHLRAWLLALPGGTRLDGAHEYTPPTLSITKASIRTGGMDVPVAHDDGMEELTCSFKVYGYDAEVIRLFGFQPGRVSPVVTARQVYQGAVQTGLTEELQGMITSIAPDARGGQGRAEAATNIEMSLSYYRQTFSGVEKICIIPEEYVRRIDGVDVLAGVRNLLRL